MISRWIPVFKFVMPVNHQLKTCFVANRSSTNINQLICNNFMNITRYTNSKPPKNDIITISRRFYSKQTLNVANITKKNVIKSIRSPPQPIRSFNKNIEIPQNQSTSIFKRLGSLFLFFLKGAQCKTSILKDM